MEVKKTKLTFKNNRTVLGLGPQAKNTLCLIKKQSVFVSPVHNNLNNPEDLVSFEKDLKAFLRQKPKIIAYDLHPEYQSTKIISRLQKPGLAFKGIQHHHAHIASCMIDNGLKNRKVIGVALDGTGLGDDNRIWGAEFLICDYRKFERKAHLREIPLLGQEAAIKEPWRLTVVWLHWLYQDKLLDLDIDFVRKIDKKKWQALRNIYLADFNSPLASSMGRLFDAAASLILTKHKARYEAELAIKLEMLAAEYKEQSTEYRFEIKKTKGIYIIDPINIFRGIILDIKEQMTKREIAYKFHLTVANIINSVSLKLRRDSGIKTVVLSGGVFQNKLLLRLTLGLLYKHKFRVLVHKNLPPNDAGISLGQAAIASFQ